MGEFFCFRWSALFVIELADVDFAYPTQFEEESGERDDSRRIIRRVSFRVKSGEFVCLLGANGCGKTTIAKLMNGLLVPSSGSVKVDGYDTVDDEELYRVRQLVGLIFQDPTRQLVASTIEDELAFGPENLGIPPAEIRQRIDWALKMLKLEDLRFREPHYLSGGQAQRVAIASVLVMQPRYLIMDEPTAMLDSAGRRSVLEVIENLRQELGMAVIYITHHMEEVMQADRVLAVKDGAIAFEGRPQELFVDERVVGELALELPALAQLVNSINKLGYKLPMESQWQKLAENLRELLH